LTSFLINQTESLNFHTPSPQSFKLFIKKKKKTNSYNKPSYLPNKNKTYSKDSFNDPKKGKQAESKREKRRRTGLLWRG
jgi:hypothetical protein